MRDIFDEIYTNQPLDPTEAARRAMRPDLRKRFYARTTVSAVPEGFAVLLDDRPVRTPARRSLAFPTSALAQAASREWDAQTEVIDPAQMPLTRLANSIIDGVTQSGPAVAEEIGRYLRCDLLFYRAEGPKGLIRRQEQLWDPVLAWARDDLGARFILVEGVVFKDQPDHALVAMEQALPRDPWRLGAVHSATTLTGSALLALALAHRRISADEAWTAAHVDEDWNIEAWGEDTLAAERRRYREAEMRAAATVLTLVEHP